MSSPVPLQMGLFGVTNDILGLHVVQAHTRLLEDGSEVFVAEHVRWNRGKKNRARARRSRASAPAPGQASLFDAPPRPDSWDRIGNATQLALLLG